MAANTKLSPDRIPAASLKGAGAQTLARLSKLGIATVQDLLFHLPFRYEDRTRLVPIGQLRHGDHALIEGKVELVQMLPTGRRSLVVRISDGTGFINLRFFHYTTQQKNQLGTGARLRCYGEAREGFYGLEMAHPDYDLAGTAGAGKADATLTPVYPTTEGVHQKALRKLVLQALSHADDLSLSDWLPQPTPTEAGNMTLAAALKLLHQPPAGCNEESPQIAAARQRLAFEELLAHHLSLSRFRQQARNHRAPPLSVDGETAERFLSALPFTPTNAQYRVMAEIAGDLAAERPMMRLVQGDVGSGKTVVAAHAALAALCSGHQVAIMAPTELLAEQHFRSFTHWLSPLGIEIAFVSGRVKGENRGSTLAAVADGTARLVLGTHALFQEQVVFHRLGLIIIDEQHRFGVHQRLALREKGARDGLYPHQLIMTATPIPRTLAMLGYADLDLSVIDERPPGRTPVKTVIVPTSRREDVIARIGDWVAKGRQVYWVCTLIEESELLQAEAAEKTAELLTQSLPQVRSVLVHGRQKPAEKEAAMQAFKSGVIDLLVATTVIEVGVDVPNAGLMVIENAERLGLAQLHQLRGRVGRGPGEAHCVLLYQPPLSQSARERLATLRDSDDGFVIAEKDLSIRGPGELLGTRQTGLLQFRVANLDQHRHLMDAVHATAETLLRDYPDRVEPLIRRWVGNAVQYVEA